MAAGDTIPGQVRAVRQQRNGDTPVILGPFAQTDLDQRGDKQNALFVNVPNDVRRAPENVAEVVKNKMAVLMPTETLKIQHLSASLEEAADYDADEFAISIIEYDQIRGTARPKTLTVQDTDVTSNPTTSTSVWTDIFEYTSPDNVITFISGQLTAVAVENA